MTNDPGSLSAPEGSVEYRVVYWPTDRVCVTYDTREEADAAVAWYKRTYGAHTNIGVREVRYVVA
jgi:hypothetical protein